MKIKSIKKFIRSIILIFVIAFFIVIFTSNSSYSTKEVSYKKISVSAGDTLWNIAKSNQINNNYYKGKDIRYIVNDLKKINNLTNSNLFENQELQIPVI